MGYGDGRVCKTLAGEFESHASHKMFRSSSGRTSPFQGEGRGFESRTEYKWSYRLMVRITDFQSVDAGSIPVRTTNINGDIERNW